MWKPGWARVVAAAKQAWEVSGDSVELGSTPVNGHAVMTSLVAVDARTVEYIVDGDDPDVWTALTPVSRADPWQQRALVPLALMGTAHERLRDHAFELQGWWLDGERVAFGRPEIA